LFLNERLFEGEIGKHLYSKKIFFNAIHLEEILGQKSIRSQLRNYFVKRIGKKNFFVGNSHGKKSFYKISKK